MIFCFIFFGTELFSAPATITFQARIVKPDLTNLESSSVSFRFLYLYPKPSVGVDAQCVIYVEDITGVNMTGSKGLVTLQMGSGVKFYGNGNLKNVFDNSTASYACQSGGTYTPAVNDNRRVIVQFNDGSGTQTLPASELTAVPFAMQSYNSQRLGNNLATDFLKFTDFTGTCAAGEYLKYDSSASPKFSCATPTGTGAGIVMSVAPGTGPLLVGGTAVDPTISITQASASTDGYLSSADFTTFNSKLSVATLLSSDITGKLGYTPAANNDSRFTDQRTPINDSVTSAKILDGTITAADLGSMGASTGQVMKWNGSAWVASSDDTGAGGAVTNVSASAPLSSTGGSTPTISLAKSNSTTDGYLSSADFTTFAAKLSDFSTLVSSDITGKLGYTPAANNDSRFTDQRTPTNDSVTSAKILDGTITSADISNGAIEANKLAQMGASSGQVLKWNGSAWVASSDDSSGGTVTSVTSGGAPIVVGGTASNPTISLAKSNSTTDGYLSSADFTIFAAKLSDFSTLSSSDITGKLGYTAANSSDVSAKVSKSGDTMSGALNLPSNGLAVGTNQLVVSGGKVGIGNSTPGDLLVVGDSLGGNVGGNAIQINNATGFATLALAKNSSNYGRFLWNDVTNKLSVNTKVGGTDFADVMTFSSAYVGIGTANPTAKLEISSGIAHTSGLKFTNFTSAAPTGTGQTLGVDASGNLITVANGGVGDALTTNPLSQFAATTSAQLIGVLSDETGTGSAVFSAAPTFTTNITTPLVIGGIGTTSTLTYKTTTGVGATGADHIFQVGNNGATEAVRILNNGNVGIGTAAPTAKLDVIGDANVVGSSSDSEGVKIQTSYSNNDTSSRITFAERQDGQYGWSLVDAATANPVLGGTTMTGLPLGSLNIVRHSASAVGIPVLSILRDFGNVGIGTTAPTQKLEVAGSINVGSQATRTTASTDRGQLAQGSTFVKTSAGSTTLDGNDGNQQEVINFVCNGANTITFSNMRDGGAYTVLLSGTAAHTGTCLFAHAGLTFKTSGGNVAPTASKDVLFTFTVIGTTVIYSMMDNLQ